MPTNLQLVAASELLLLFVILFAFVWIAALLEWLASRRTRPVSQRRMLRAMRNIRRSH